MLDLITEGRVAEWFKAPLSKSGMWETTSGVRILSLPPKLEIGIRSRPYFGFRFRFPILAVLIKQSSNVFCLIHTAQRAVSSVGRALH